MNCINCGNEITQGSVFCVHCGARQEVAARPINTVPQPDSSFNIAMDSVVKVFKAPIAFMRGVSKVDSTPYIILSIAAILFFGLMAIWTVNRGVNEMYSLFAGLISSSIPLAAFSKGSVSSLIPYGEIFGQALIFGILVLGGLFAGLLAVGKAYKAELPALQYLNVAVTGFIPFLASLAAALLCSYVSVGLAILLVKAGSVWSTLCYYSGLEGITGESSERNVMGLAAVYAFLYGFVYIGIKVIS